MSFRSFAGFWNFPQLYNASQEIDAPPIYAPYGTPGFWQPATNPAHSNSLAPNSGQGYTVGAAMSAASSAIAASPPATPAIAAATGQPMAPVTLVSPLPSITAVPNAVATNGGPLCSLNSWVAANPMLAAAGAFGLFLLLKGGRR